MNPSFHGEAFRFPVRMRWFLGVAGILILSKGVLVDWARHHWPVPFSPGWIIAPTLMFAALATVLWAAPHNE